MRSRARPSPLASASVHVAFLPDSRVIAQGRIRTRAMLARADAGRRAGEENANGGRGGPAGCCARARAAHASKLSRTSEDQKFNAVDGDCHTNYRIVYIF